MTTQEQYIGRLKELAVAKYGHDVGSKESYALFASAISEATGLSVDAEAVEQLFVSRRGVAPRPAILSAMAKYIGYDSWIAFCTSSEVLPVDDVDVIPTTRRCGVIILTIMALVVVGVAIGYLVVDSTSAPSPKKSAVLPNISLDELCADVEEQWVASTIELCNTARAYSGSEEYAMRRNQFIRAYEDDLDDAVRRDVERAVAEHGASYTEAEITCEVERITRRCRTMLEGL